MTTPGKAVGNGTGLAARTNLTLKSYMMWYKGTPGKYAGSVYVAGRLNGKTIEALQNVGLSEPSFSSHVDTYHYCSASGIGTYAGKDAKVLVSWHQHLTDASKSHTNVSVYGSEKADALFVYSFPITTTVVMPVEEVAGGE